MGYPKIPGPPDLGFAVPDTAKPISRDTPNSLKDTTPNITLTHNRGSLVVFQLP